MFWDKKGSEFEVISVQFLSQIDDGENEMNILSCSKDNIIKIHDLEGNIKSSIKTEENLCWTTEFFNLSPSFFPKIDHSGQNIVSCTIDQNLIFHSINKETKEISELWKSE